MKIRVLGILFILLLAGCGADEGTVEFDDCRTIITLPTDTLQKYYKTFTCVYARRASGKIVSATCVHVDIDAGLLSGSGKCKTAYVYTSDQTQPDRGCTKGFLFLGKEKCYKNWQDADSSLLE
jgi:hypothetical protein